MTIRNRPAGVWSRREGRFHGFTLVELLVAVAIGLLILGLAVPALRAIKRPPLTQATKDLLEACAHARARAIMEGRPTQLVIRDGGGQFAVESAPDGIVGATNGVVADWERISGQAVPASFARRIEDPSVAFEAINVNSRSFMESDATAIRFFPNGTADEFEAVISWRRGEARRIRVEAMTGIATASSVQ